MVSRAHWQQQHFVCNTNLRCRLSQTSRATKWRSHKAGSTKNLQCLGPLWHSAQSLPADALSGLLHSPLSPHRPQRSSTHLPLSTGAHCWQLLPLLQHCSSLGRCLLRLVIAPRQLLPVSSCCIGTTGTTLGDTACVALCRSASAAPIAAADAAVTQKVSMVLMSTKKWRDQQQHLGTQWQ